ncbi:class I tRNA ligase family protein [Rugamonas rubra]|uniref:valine--tRNA ligase n=1 Tax=Rugamonas rubra TaxID=758825 RepID=A0A1I4HU15_9BURK|nr:class I tRNA ligase family protein [Rugamonas rubra]SFL45514.1 Valyl-tRNA synthetase [Rugamonas rubra]
MNPHSSTRPRAKADEAGTFVLLPPPNVTGDLHLGHGFSFTLLDTYVRFLRKRGETVRFHPGTEHAGSRAEIAYARLGAGRDKPDFLTWQDKTRQSIIGQIKLMGVDADWGDEYNSMDDRRVEFIRGAFVKLSNDGFIYPSTEMVNWCPCCDSSLPDIDVKFSCKAGTRYLLSLSDSKPGFTIATFGLERLLGATALAVSPRHRFADELDGTRVRLLGREIAVTKAGPGDFADPSVLIAINPQVNPADFRAAGSSAGANLYDRDGNIGAAHRDFRADNLAASRNALEARLVEDGWSVEKEAVDHHTPHCAVCNAEVHPMISEQWYFDIAKGLERTRRNPEFHSKLWKKGFELWMEKLRRPLENAFHESMNTSHYGGYSSNRDFLVSSQSGWGQPLPVLRCLECGTVSVAAHEPDQCRACGARRFEASGEVISIFFSCCLMGASTNPSSLRRNAVDFTICGHDIYHYWGSLKNILACALGYEAGFGGLMVHGLLVDQSGEKMTKSKGNVVGLAGLVDRYGVDTLRTVVYDCVYNNHDRPFIKFDPADFSPAHSYIAELKARLLEHEIDEHADEHADESADNVITDSAVQYLRTEIDALMEGYKIGHAYKKLLSVIDQRKIVFKTHSAKIGFLKLLYPFHPSFCGESGSGENQ